MPTSTEIINFRRQLHGVGIVTIADQDRVIDVARRCTATGVVTGAGWAVLGAPAAAPGALAGFLSGFVAGTATCMGLSYAARDALRKLSEGGDELP